jgi:hypothetical protein
MLQNESQYASRNEEILRKLLTVCHFVVIVIFNINILLNRYDGDCLKTYVLESWHCGGSQHRNF